MIEKQFLNFVTQYGDPSFTPDILESIRARTLVVHGDSDEIAPAENGWQLYKNIPSARLWIVPYGVHHFLFLPEHADLFNKIVGDFLNRK